MRKLGIVALTIVLLIGGFIVWHKITYPAYTYRYRMTVEVMVGSALHSSSSVIEVELQTQSTFLQTPPLVPHLRGDAVFVDLGGDRNVIALLVSGPNGRDVDYYYRIVPLLFHVSYADRELPKLANMRGGREVPVARMPTFVTFADLNDPTTARVVRPDNFQKVFGVDVTPPRVSIEMTKDAVTRTIENKMPLAIQKLREENKVMHLSVPGSPYEAALGQFSAGR